MKFVTRSAKMLLVAAGVMVVQAAPALAAAGDLDSTFGTSGKTVVSLSSAQDLANASLVLDSGKIVIVGQDAGNGNGDIAVMQFTATGAPDPAFGGGDGITTVAFDGGAVDTANDVQVQSDGKLVVVGETGGDAAVVRLNSDGSVDTGFDGSGGPPADGLIALDATGVDAAEAVAIDSDGKILVAGSSGGEAAPAVWRLETDGSLDTTFSSDGFHNLSDIADAGDMVLTNVFYQSNGQRIVLPGVDSGRLAVVRLNSSDGSADSSFNGGYVQAPAVGTDDRAYAATSNNGRVTVAGSTTDGGGDSDTLIAKFTNDGAVDTSFGGGDGVETFDSGGTQDVAYDLLEQADGTFLTAGGNGNDIQLVQFTAAGALDTAFGANGVATIEGSGASMSDVANGVDLQATDGKIVIAATISVGVADTDPAVLRLQGTTDGTSGTGGTGTGGTGGTTTVVTQPDLGVSLTDSPDPTVTGDTVTFTGTLTNTGNANQTGASATFTGPAGSTFKSASSTTAGVTCSVSGVTATCSLGNFSAGSTATITATATFSVAGSATTTFSAAGNATESSTANNTTTTTTTVKQRMVLAFGPSTKTGKIKRCGKKIGKPCVTPKSKPGWFAGTLKPTASATAGQVVTIKIERRVSGKKFKTVKSVKVKLNARKKFIWKRKPSFLKKGFYRISTSVAETATTSSATSAYRFMKLT